MSHCKSSHSKTREFQIKTGLGLLLLLGVLWVPSPMTGDVYGRMSQPDARKRTGVVLVAVAKDFASEGEKITHVLVKELKRRYGSVELITGPISTEGGHGLELDPQQALGEIKLAWEAYYKLDFFKALRHLDKAEQFSEQSEREGKAPSGSASGGGDASPYQSSQQEVLRALLRFAQGKQAEAEQILQALRLKRPQLRLHAESFPPQFVRLFTR